MESYFVGYEEILNLTVERENFQAYPAIYDIIYVFLHARERAIHFKFADSTTKIAFGLS